MAARRLPWIKLWPESVDHEKLSMLSDGAFRTWIHALTKASQQPTRWRFASIQHAANVTGRPLKHIQELIKGRLLDVRDGEVWIHDYRDWQEVYESDMPLKGKGQDSVNPLPTLREHSDEDSVNTPARTRGPASDGRWEMGDVRPETGEGNPPGGAGGAGGLVAVDSSPSAPPAVAPLGRVKPAPKKPGGANLTPLIDAFRAAGLSPPALIRAEPTAAQELLRHYSPEQLATCWQDHASGDYGDDFSRRTLSFGYLANNNRVGNWLAWKSAPKATRTNGHQATAPPSADALERSRIGQLILAKTAKQYGLISPGEDSGNAAD